MPNWQDYLSTERLFDSRQGAELGERPILGKERRTEDHNTVPRQPDALIDLDHQSVSDRERELIEPDSEAALGKLRSDWFGDFCLVLACVGDEDVVLGSQASAGRRRLEQTCPNLDWSESNLNVAPDFERRLKESLGP